MLNILALTLSTILLGHVGSSGTTNRYQFQSFDNYGDITYRVDYDEFIYAGRGVTRVVSYYDTENSTYYDLFSWSYQYLAIQPDSTRLRFQFSSVNTCNLSCKFSVFDYSLQDTFSTELKLYTDFDIAYLNIPMSASLFADDEFDITMFFTIVDYSLVSSTYQDGYNQGVIDGIETGKKIGYEDAIRDLADSTYQNGYDNGYGIGYNAGISAGGYSFLNLFGAVADTPVLMIRNLFNFDLFGMSMLTIVLSLFTCLLLFHILKKFIK